MNVWDTFRAVTQHRRNNFDNKSKEEGKDQESIHSGTTHRGYLW